MYTILVTDTNQLVTTVKERIIRKSKLVNNLQFLVSQTYNGLDMSAFTVCMEYRLPISHDYCSEILGLSDDLYKEKLQYTLPIDTSITKEAGEVEIQLTFTLVELDEDTSEETTYVRKTTPTTLTIEPVSAWSDMIPDSALTAIDQRLLVADAQIKALELLGSDFAQTKADNLIVENNKISLVAAGEKIGDEWDIAVPAINDGDYDGTYDGMLDLDTTDTGSDGDDTGGGTDDDSGNTSQEFIEL